MRTRRMAAVQVGSNLSHRIGKDRHQHGVVAEEIDGLIKAYKDGHVERPQIVPCVTSSLAPELGVTSRDTVIDKFKNIWARFYVPIKFHGKLPLLVYFHGGGFCVGSAAWSCYHDFLARLAAKANCIIMSVNYRLAPENPLPAAYDDGVKALMWLKQQALCGGADNWWTSQWSFSDIFLAGDSAGANIAFNVITRLDSFNAGQAAAAIKPLKLKGIILIQPFFGGEARTHSEKYLVQSPRSALNLAASDTYWRLALPCGANRDHPWCNPLAKGSVKLEGSVKFPIMVCISEMDILKDRNLELVASLGRAGNKRVEHVVCKGVGHAFQILSKSQLSQTRTLEIMARIEGFISGKRSPLSTTVHNLM
ncbi:CARBOXYLESTERASE 6-RELATED [Salix viminalis]|uniref:CARBOXYLESTERASE 6-RELATED n=1 Tax=Salix viminalis TaxID=40686 RepID=A0A9Q0U0A5_SALVM|nr:CARBOXYLESTERASE 6-RELATED [Salix viminalis]